MKRALAAGVLVLSALAVTGAAKPPQSPEERAQGVAGYVRERVGDVVGSVRGRVGARVEEAQAQLLRDGGEIEHGRVRPAGAGGRGLEGGEASSNFLRRAWARLTQPLWSARGQAGAAAEAAYGQAAGLKNAAGQSWDEAAAAAHAAWLSSKSATRESWDDAKRAAWKAWASTVAWPPRAARAVQETAQAGADAVAGAASGAAGAAADAAAGGARGAAQAAGAAWDAAAAPFNYAADRAAQSWRAALGGAYHQWQATKATSRQSWADAKRAAWKNWKAAEGSAHSTYDAAKDSANDAYEAALHAAYATWQSTKDTSGQGWDAARDAFDRAWHLGASRPEAVLSSAWERWQHEKSQTGQTWDEAKRTAMREYDAARAGGGAAAAQAVGAAKQWTESNTRGWESWLKSSWGRVHGANGGGPPAEGWEAAKDTAHKTYEAVTQAGAQTWAEARKAAEDSYQKVKDKTGERSWGDWMQARAYTGAAWPQVLKDAQDYWTEAKGKTQVGFDAFAASAWEAWLRARAAAGAPAEEVESAARDYYKALSKGGRLFGGGHKGKTPEGTAEEFVARARATAAAAAAGAGSWFDGVTEAVACRWDATKCRVREMMHAGGAAGAGAEAARRKAHKKVDELHQAAKAEL